MTLTQRRELISSILILAIKENYKGVNEIDRNTGYVEKEISKIFNRLKDCKDEDKFNSCFLTNQMIESTYADLIGNYHIKHIYNSSQTA